MRLPRTVSRNWKRHSIVVQNVLNSLRVAHESTTVTVQTDGRMDLRTDRHDRL